MYFKRNMLSNCTPVFRILPDGIQEVLIDTSVSTLENISKNLSDSHKEDDKNGTTYWNCTHTKFQTPGSPMPEPPLYIMLCVSLVYIAIFIMGVTGQWFGSDCNLEKPWHENHNEFLLG